MSFGDPSGPSNTYVQHAATCSDADPRNRTDTGFGSRFDVADGLMQTLSSDGSNGERRYAAGYFANPGVKALTNAKARYECRACQADFGQSRDFASPSSRRNLPPRDRHDPGLIRARFGIVHDFGPESSPFSLRLESTPFGVLFRSSSTGAARTCMLRHTAPIAGSTLYLCCLFPL